MNAPDCSIPYSSLLARPWLRALLFGLLLHSASCDTGDASGPDGALASWHLSDEPTVVIGGADEREGYLLH